MEPQCFWHCFVGKYLVCVPPLSSRSLSSTSLFINVLQVIGFYIYSGKLSLGSDHTAAFHTKHNVTTTRQPWPTIARSTDPPPLPVLGWFLSSVLYWQQSWESIRCWLCVQFFHRRSLMLFCCCILSIRSCLWSRMCGYNLVSTVSSPRPSIWSGPPQWLSSGRNSVWM